MEYEQKEESIEEAGIKATGTAAYLAFSGIFTLLVYGLAFIAVARLLGPSNYGVYVIAVSIAGAFGAVGNFGVATYFERQIPVAQLKGKKELSNTLSSAFLAILLLSLGIVAVGLASSSYLSQLIFHSDSELSVLYVAIVSILFSMLYGTGHGALIGFNDGKGSAIASAVYTLTQTVISISLVLLGFGVLGAVLGLFAGLLLGTCVLLVFISRHAKLSIHVDNLAKRMKSIFSFSMPIAGSNFVSALPSNLAVVLLGMYAAKSVVGDYGVASRVASILGIFTGSLVVMLPLLSGMLARKRTNKEFGSVLSYLLYVIFLFSTPFVVFFAMFSHEIMSTVFPEYAGVYEYITLMSLSVLFSMLSAPASSFIVGKAKVKKVLEFSSIIGISELVLIFVLVPEFKAFGAIASLYFFGALLGDLLYLREAHKEGIIIKAHRLYRVLIANALLCVVFLPLIILRIYSTYALLAGFALIFVFYPPALVAAKALDKQDAERLAKASSSIPFVGSIVRLLLKYALKFAYVEKGV
ncbi:MAG: oligosaccharide flippase family protein [Candidatus Micrarchaeia archaeon]